MNTTAITRVFENAEKDGRSFLLEHEVYELLGRAGLAAPKHLFVPKGSQVRKADLAALGSGTVVLKVVSPLILHKSDVGGVRFAKAEPRAVNAACAEMLAEVPGRFLEWSKRFERAGKAERPARKAVADSVRGVLVCEKVAFDDVGFGSELLVGVRNTREFGPVMTVGGGGLDVEYMNERIKEGRSAALFSVPLVDDARLGALIEPLAFFGKVALPFRGRRPRVAPAALAATLRRFVGLFRALSSSGGAPPTSSRNSRSILSSSGTEGSFPWTVCAGSPGGRPLPGRGRSRRSVVSSARRRSGSSGSPRRGTSAASSSRTS